MLAKVRTDLPSPVMWYNWAATKFWGQKGLPLWKPDSSAEELRRRFKVLGVHESW